jgi:hypothetical protein
LQDQVTKEDGTSTSLRYLFEIEAHHRAPAPYALHTLARMLALDYNTPSPFAGAAASA